MAVVFFPSCGEDDEMNPPVTGDDITVTGTVTDDTDAAVEGVTVSAVTGSATTTTDASGAYSITVAEDDMLSFEKDGFISFTVEVNSTAAIDAKVERGPGLKWAAAFDADGNLVADPGFGAADIKPSNMNLGNLSTPGGFFDDTNYKGAVDPASMAWYSGWTSYENVLAGGETKAFTQGTLVTITDADLSDGMDQTWTKNNTYILDGLVFVNDGQTLTIEPGTVIKGKSGEAENSSALVVAQGGKLLAEGTAAEPITFTFEGDDGSGQAPTLRGQWGGLIVLGKAGLNSSPGTSAIEGIPTNEPRGTYGGTADDDNSGVIKYVSIRHGGTNIGDDNEINGLTLGGVGTGTVIDFVEVIANKDDGIEWFGGTVNAKHLLSIFCGDDALDYDEGYRGNNQYIIVHQDPALDAADRGGEHDGGTDPETGMPFATPFFLNVTAVGNDGSRTITFRDNAGGQYHNSIFVNFDRVIDIDDIPDQDQDSYQQCVDVYLAIGNCVFFNIDEGTAPTDLFKVSNP